MSQNSKPLETRRSSSVAEVRALDHEAQTVELSFSSESPVDRSFGVEILDHAPGSVRIGRLNGAAPLLVNHNPDDQVGVVESARIDGDRVGRAVVRFSRGARGQEIFRDVVDGIRKLVSVGYVVHKARQIAEGFRVVDWEPIEISIVPVPADANVGFGRDFSTSLQSEEFQMADDKKPAQAESAPNVIEINDIAERARIAERDRCQRIEKIGAKYGHADMARKFVESGATVDAFMDALVAIEDAQPKQRPLSDLDMPRREAQQYSLTRAIMACLTRDWSRAGLELECSRAIADKSGREARGFWVPGDIWRRTQTVATDSGGGFLVGVDHMASEFIDNLRAQSVCLGLGARVLDGLVGDLSIPKKTASATFYWVDEDAAPTDSGITLGAVTLTPHCVAGAVPMTRKLLLQSSPSIEALVRSDLITGCALAIDNAIIDGSGVSGEPTGVVNTANVNTQSVSSDAAPTYAEIVGFESQVAADNALAGRLAYLTTPTMRGTLKTTDMFSGAGRPVWSGDNMVNGYPAAVSTQVASNMIIFGNWAEVLVGMWGMMDIKPDEATKASTGGLVLRVFQDVDVALRHPESFCIAT